MREQEWLNQMGWKEIPFSPADTDLPKELIVGFDETKDRLRNAVQQGGGYAIMLVAPPGAGKTTLLKWISREASEQGNVLTIFFPTPPTKNELVGHMHDKFGKKKGILSFLSSQPEAPSTIHGVPDFLKQIARGKKVAFLVDEVEHCQYSDEIKEGLDHFSNLLESVDATLILATIPDGERNLPSSLKTRTLDYKRETLRHMNEKEVREMIAARIGSVGGKGAAPFSDEAIGNIYAAKKGVPRATIALCREAVDRAIESGATEITAAFISDVAAQTAKKERVEVREAVREVSAPEAKEGKQEEAPDVGSGSFLDLLSGGEREILAVIAKNPSKTADQLAKIAKKSPGTVKVTVARLLGRDRKREGVPYPLLKYDEVKEGRAVKFAYRLSDHVERLFAKE